MYEELKEYWRQHGDCLVKQSSGKLGRWVDIQRQRRKGPHGRQKRLTDEQVRLLDEINFGWSATERFQQLWDQRYELLKEYRYKNEHCLVTRRHPVLGRWVEGLRARRKGQKKSLTEEQTRRLDEIGFVWEAKKRQQPVSVECQSKHQKKK